MSLNLDAHLEAKRLLYKHSLALTAKKLLGYKDVNPRTHGDMIRALEAPTKRKLIVMPRGTFKSSVSSVSYPIWLLLNNPNLRILINSEVFTNSKNWLREIKANILRPEFIDLFGDWRTNVWNEAEINIAPRTSTQKESSISVGSCGTIKVGMHYDIIINDDLNSNNNSLTPEACLKVIDFYKMQTSLLEPDGTMVVIGTRYNMQDVIGFILDNEIDENKANSG